VIGRSHFEQLQDFSLLVQLHETLEQNQPEREHVLETPLQERFPSQWPYRRTCSILA
jgi:hypothetical protein